MLLYCALSFVVSLNTVNLFIRLLQISEAADSTQWEYAVSDAEEYLELCGCSGQMLLDRSRRDEIIKAGVKFYLEDRVERPFNR